MPVSVDDIPNLRQWIDDGLTLAQMGQRLGSKRQTVHAFLKKHDIPYEKRGHWNAYNGRWKGGRIVDKDGYVMIKNHAHPNKNRHGYVREHRLVMEQKLGRYLEPEEVVHHLDGNRQNNHPDNLEVFSANNLHLASTLAGKVPNWTEEGKEAIRQGVKNRRSPSRKRTEPSA